MASSSSELISPNIVKILSPAALVPLCIPSGLQRAARVTAQVLSIRFGFGSLSLSLEKDVLDPITLNVMYSMVVEPSPMLVNEKHV